MEKNSLRIDAEPAPFSLLLPPPSFALLSLNHSVKDFLLIASKCSPDGYKWIKSKQIKRRDTLSLESGFCRLEVSHAV